MRFMRIPSIFFSFLILISCCKQTVHDQARAIPKFRVIHDYSDKVKSILGLALSSYGLDQKKDQESGNVEIETFDISYRSKKTQQDKVSINEARRLVVSISEGLLNNIQDKSNEIPELKDHPAGMKSLMVSIYFKDENQVALGNGVSRVINNKGKVKYECYKIEKYEGKYPATGKNQILLEESYEEALKIVKRQGSLIPI